jgi:hypothetical protein
MSAAPELRLVEPAKRPSGSEIRKRGRRVTVRLSPTERAELEAAANRAGLSLGSYVRARVLEKPTTRATRRPPVEKAALAQLLGQVGRIGGNLAQITRHLNFGDIDGAEGLPEALADLGDMKAALMAALGRTPA